MRLPLTDTEAVAVPASDGDRLPLTAMSAVPIVACDGARLPLINTEGVAVTPSDGTKRPLAGMAVVLISPSDVAASLSIFPEEGIRVTVGLKPWKRGRSLLACVTVALNWAIAVNYRVSEAVDGLSNSPEATVWKQISLNRSL
jgi:hypothetical protein